MKLFNFFRKYKNFFFFQVSIRNIEQINLPALVKVKKVFSLGNLFFWESIRDFEQVN